jgi:hypothetical protein
MLHTELELGDGVLVNGHRAVVIEVYTTGALGFTYDCEVEPPQGQGRLHFFLNSDRMDEVERDPEGPWGPYYSFLCTNKANSCAYSRSERMEMKHTALSQCPNCTASIKR